MEQEFINYLKKQYKKYQLGDFYCDTFFRNELHRFIFKNGPPSSFSEGYKKIENWCRTLKKDELKNYY